MDKIAVFMISDEIFGITIDRVVEIIKVQKVFTVPGLPDFLSGVMSVRGSVIPIIDLRIRFGMKPSRVKERIIIVTFEQGKIGVLVDEIRDILTLTSGELLPAPSLFKGFKAEFISGLAKKGESIIILLNIDTLFSSEERIRLKQSLDMIEGSGAGDQKKA